MKIQKINRFNRIYQAECFPDEVDKMIGKSSGDKRRCINWLDAKLSILDKKGMSALNLEQFEYLKGTSNPKLYAIRHPHSNINERYLFVFAAGESSTLLTAFKEKGVLDYHTAIHRAKNIYAELGEYHEL